MVQLSNITQMVNCKVKEAIEDGQVKIYDTVGTLIKIYVFEDKKPIETIKIR